LHTAKQAVQPAAQDTADNEGGSGSRAAPAEPVGQAGAAEEGGPLADFANKGRGRAVVTPAEVDYYSIFNAPLVPFLRFASVSLFLRHALPELAPVERKEDREGQEMEGGRGGRKMVAVESTPDALCLYGAAARAHLASPDLYVVVGSEAFGLPRELLQRSHAVVRIPSLSASINVSCALMAVLTVMLADQFQRSHAAGAVTAFDSHD